MSIPSESDRSLGKRFEIEIQMLLNINFMDQGWWVTNDRRLHFPVFRYLTS